MASVILFIDTNGFIQLYDLKDLKWRELFPGVKQVRIMVARAVIEELDKHKTSTKDRQRNRARAALKLIAEASKAKDRVLKLKDKPVTVTLEIPPRAKLDWDSLSILDPNKSDDRLVAEAVTYGNDAAIFSHDSGPRLTADDMALKSYEPLEDWHLPSEQSDADKKIALLERQLEAAKSTKPRLGIGIEGRDPSGKLTLYRPILPPLEDEQIKRLLDRYLAKYPRAAPVATIPNFMAMSYSDGLSPAQVDSYHADYDDFQERVRKFLQSLHEYSYYLVVPTVEVRTTNNGSVSAINFHVTLEASGGFGILSSAKAIRKLSPFPEPPDEPEPRGILRGFHHNLIRGGMMPSPPHPTEIVWIDKPKHSDTYGRYGCQDFQPERSDIREVALWPNDELPATGVLTVTAGANDVPDTSECVEITIEKREEAWHSAQVVESFPGFLHNELKALKWGEEAHEKLTKIGAGLKKPTKSSRPKRNTPARP